MKNGLEQCRRNPCIHSNAGFDKFTQGHTLFNNNNGPDFSSGKFRYGGYNFFDGSYQLL